MNRYVIIDSANINKLIISDGFAFAYLKYRFGNKNAKPLPLT